MMLISCRESFGENDPPKSWSPLAEAAFKLVLTSGPRPGGRGGLFTVEPDGPWAVEGELASISISSVQSVLQRLIGRLDLADCPVIAATNLTISHPIWPNRPQRFGFAFDIAVLGCRSDVPSLIKMQSAISRAAGKAAFVPKMPMDAPCIQLRELMRNSLVRSSHDCQFRGDFAPTRSQLAEARRWWQTHPVSDRLILVGIERRGNKLIGVLPSHPGSEGRVIRRARRNSMSAAGGQ